MHRQLVQNRVVILAPFANKILQKLCCRVVHADKTVAASIPRLTSGVRNAGTLYPSRTTHKTNQGIDYYACNQDSALSEYFALLL